jgi:hypothetical protein
MRKVLTVGAGLILVLALPSVAEARGPANEFAVGSAKTELEVVIADFSEHASLSAHNTTGPSCQATGQVNYKSLGADFTAKIVVLTIDPVLDPVFGTRAFLAGPITRAASGPFGVGKYVYFDVTDSGMPGGFGDTFASFSLEPSPGGVCLEPGVGHAITEGNIVIKASGPLP